MWNTLKRFLVTASVAGNIAFASVWFVHSIPAGSVQEDKTPESTATARVWCPLHEQLRVTDGQWELIEPQLKEFRESARSVADQIGKFRSEVLDLIATPSPDRETIVAKQEEIRICQRKMQDMVVDHLLAEREILTTEQAEQLFALLREHSRGGRGSHAGLSGSSQRGFGHVLREDPATK